MNLNRLLMMDLSTTELTPDERAFLSEYQPGGVCLFSRNICDRFQAAEYVAELLELCGPDLLVATDQEGGGVVRLRDVPYPPSAMALGAADDPNLTREVAAATARGLKAVGINVDFAPVADVNNNPRNPVIAERAFGGEAAQVARHVVAFVQGLQAEGVAATVKHFPGHGDTEVDSHLALPQLDVDPERLAGLELVPFKAALAAGTAALMSAHIVVPHLDDCPATLSRPILTDLLRDTLGFDGVIFSDALNMRAIADAYGPTEAALRALAAGMDMPLHMGPLNEHRAIIERFQQALSEGRLSEEEVGRSLQRLERMARRYPAQPQPDAAWRDGDEALLAEAARRAVVTLGDFEPFAPNSSLYLITAQRVAGGAASDAVDKPTKALADELSQLGFEVTTLPYDRDTADHTDLFGTLDKVTKGATALFVSTARTRMEESELNLARRVAKIAPHFCHVALWNPYHVDDLPGPALVTFGFREVSARAAAQVLARGEAQGRSPVPLTPYS